MTPWSVVVALMAPIAGRLSDRYPPGLLGGVGLAIMCAGMVSLALLPAHPHALEIGIRMAICGAGFRLLPVAEPEGADGERAARAQRRRERRRRDGASARADDGRGAGRVELWHCGAAWAGARARRWVRRSRARRASRAGCGSSRVIPAAGRRFRRRRNDRAAVRCRCHTAPDISAVLTAATTVLQSPSNVCLKRRMVGYHGLSSRSSSSASRRRRQHQPERLAERAGQMRHRRIH